ncbi:helix-turn-helix domain-containing protein [Streptomyces sp. SP2-10]|uniref:helix-turn-helix domain-containing protein n=1 Tax=Streptomyces sp. SP2-10 TaxID=2873385 RepID=UPI001CA6BD3A|nr:helix-turn-helix domain-containing protein [Streptomyces sp. SP2-10]MBY8847145.1 helix-turn-helix domain-containing protein [Streptomyces sp. SP2-10]
MIETVFRTEDLSVTDRVDAWREKLSQIHAPVDLACRPDSDFRAQQRVVQLGGALVWSSAWSPQTIRRTPRLIRHSDPEVVHLSLITRGAVGFRVGGPDALYGPYELRTNDSSRPFEILMGPQGEVVDAVSVDVPRARLPLSSDDLDRVIGHRMTGQEGVGALLAAFLTTLTDNTRSYTAADVPRLETILVDLLAAVFANALDAMDCLPAESRRRTLTLRVQAFIRDHLHDPDLTPTTIAAAHHISTSHLHRLFQDSGTTVAGLIRHLRLERAREQLADPARSDVPVHLVAVRSGFEHHAVFTRAFRSAYGMSPRDYRRCALLHEAGGDLATD